MHILDVIVEKCGLTMEQAQQVMETILDYGIPLYCIDELDGYYSNLQELLDDSLLYDEPMSVSFAVEYDRRLVKDGVLQ